MTVGVSSFATYSTSYEQRTPYLTTTEYNNAPTAMDTSNLLPNTAGSVAQQIALQEVIGRASSWIDQFCCGAWGTLAATKNQENARVWGNRYGQLVVHPKYWPILSVDTFSYSPVGSSGFGLSSGFAPNAASITPSGNVWIEPQQFVVQPSGIVQFGQLGSVGITTAQYFVNFSYTNGWPNTTLAASVAAGAASIQPSVVTGIYPGTMMTLYDLPNDEPITVASTYVPGNAIIPLVSALQYSHGTTATVTNLPPAVKQAAICATTALIKERGSGALEVQDMGAIIHQQSGSSQGGEEDWVMAELLLEPFKQQFVGY